MSRFEWLEVPGKKDKKQEEKLDKTEFNEEYYLERAEENYLEGFYEKALRLYSRVLNMNNREEKAWLGQLLCLIDLGEYKEAITWADKALEMYPGAPEFFAIKALAHGRLGNLDKAKGFSDTSMKSGGNKSFIWWARGDILISQKQLNAEICFNKALELDKNDWKMFLRIGKTYLSIKKTLKAKELFIRARNIDQKNSLVWYWLGITHQELGSFDEARQCFLRAREISPQNPDYKKALENLDNTSTANKLISKISNLLKRR